MAENHELWEQIGKESRRVRRRRRFIYGAVAAGLIFMLVIGILLLNGAGMQREAYRRIPITREMTPSL